MNNTETMPLPCSTDDSVPRADWKKVGFRKWEAAEIGAIVEIQPSFARPVAYTVRGETVVGMAYSVHDACRRAEAKAASA